MLRIWLTLIIVCLGCQTSESLPERPWVPPDEPGAFEVGRTTLYFRDVRDKPLVVDVWYPAIVSDDDVRSIYEPTNYRGRSFQDAELDLRYGAHPLVAFSHGYVSIRFQSFYLMEHLASHGFVVLSVDHNSNTLFDLNPDNDVAMMLERPDDVRYAVDKVQELANQPGLLTGALDGENYAAMGHSFGAVTVLRLGGAVVDWDALSQYCEDGQGNGRVCQVLRSLDPSELADVGEADARVSTTLPLSPGLWYAFGAEGEGLSSVVEPFVLTGDVDTILSWSGEAEPTWQALSGPKRLALFEDVGHYGFSFLCEVLPNFQPECEGPAGGWADLDWVHDRSQTLVAAHLGLTMMKDERYRPWLIQDDSWEGITMESVP